MMVLDCPECGGFSPAIGQLGDRRHFKCRDCGWMGSMDVSHEKEEENGEIEEVSSRS